MEDQGELQAFTDKFPGLLANLFGGRAQAGFDIVSGTVTKDVCVLIVILEGNTYIKELGELFYEYMCLDNMDMKKCAQNVKNSIESRERFIRESFL